MTIEEQLEYLHEQVVVPACYRLLSQQLIDMNKKLEAMGCEINAIVVENDDIGCARMKLYAKEDAR